MKVTKRPEINWNRATMLLLKQNLADCLVLVRDLTDVPLAEALEEQIIRLQVALLKIQKQYRGKLRDEVRRA